MRIGYKYWDEFKRKYVVEEAGEMDGRWAHIKNPNIMMPAHYDPDTLNWWEPCDEEPGFVLMD